LLVPLRGLKVTRFLVHFSPPDKEAPEGVHDSLETALTLGYERLYPSMQADFESGKISTA
jgi:hypothetical protein